MEISEIRGYYNVTLDDKGRLLLPVKLRAKLPVDAFVLTKSVDSCLWLFPVEHWNKLVEGIRARKSIFDDKYQMIYRRLIAPAEEIPVDKSGRIRIQPSLVRSGRLERDCLLIGMDDHVEIWDEKIFESYEESCAPSVKDGWQDFLIKGEPGI